MPKRKHTDNSKTTTEKQARYTGIEPTFENALSQSTVFSDFFDLLPAHVLAKLSTTNKLFHALSDNDRYQNDVYWKTKLTTDFHQPNTNEDYKAQYIAEYLLQKAETTADNHYYIQLKKHMAQHTEKNWAHYYAAILSKHEELKGFYGKRTTMQYALAALSTGELRAGEFIIDYYAKQLADGLAFSSYRLDRMLDTLHNLPSHITASNAPAITRLRCFTHALIANSTQSHNKEYNIQIALDCLKQLLVSNSQNIKEFLTLALSVFQLSGLISITQSNELQQDQELLASVTVFDAVKLLLKKSLPTQIESALLTWVRERENLQDSVACYFLAEKIRNNITVKLLSRHNGYLNSDDINIELEQALAYYKLAFLGGEYRAVGQGLDRRPGGLYLLLAIKPDLPLMTREEFWAMVKEGLIQDNDKFCTLILATDYLRIPQWYKDPHKVWVVQLAASFSDEYGQAAYNALYRLADNPDSPLMIHCALSLILAKSNPDESYRMYEFVANINPDLPDNYLKDGYKMGLCGDEHEVTFYRHANTRRAELESHTPAIDHYFLRRH